MLKVPLLRRNQVEQVANDVLRQHGLTSVPINPVTIAQKEGFQINNAKFSDDSLLGMIARRPGNLLMLIRAEDSPNRKRFTIAHELGHHFLHLLSDGEFIDHEADLFREEYVEQDTPQMSENQRAEVQANMFAAALLMPEEHMRHFWQQLRSIKKMAELFGVSEEAMGYRINRLGLATNEQ